MASCQDNETLALEIVAQLHLIGCPHVPAQDTLTVLLGSRSRPFLRWLHAALPHLPGDAASHNASEENKEGGEELAEPSISPLLKRRAAQKAALLAQHNRLQALLNQGGAITDEPAAVVQDAGANLNANAGTAAALDQALDSVAAAAGGLFGGGDDGRQGGGAATPLRCACLLASGPRASTLTATCAATRSLCASFERSSIPLFTQVVLVVKQWRLVRRWSSKKETSTRVVRRGREGRGPRRRVKGRVETLSSGVRNG